MDSETRMIYVSGGRVVDGDWESVKYSGLYSYNVQTGKWKLLQYVPLMSPVQRQRPYYPYVDKQTPSVYIQISHRGLVSPIEKETTKLCLNVLLALE